MNAVLQDLLKLQELDFGENDDKATEPRIVELRAKIPAPILGHYDRLRLRGKKGVAIVRNQVCTGCHMQQPIGKITVLMRDEDIQLCDSCGRYLHLPTETENQPVEAVDTAKPEGLAPAPKPQAGEKPASKTKTPRKPRKRKPLETVA